VTADLVAFLRARLDEDEQVARSVPSGPWRWTPEANEWDQNGPMLVSEEAGVLAA
jgi:hypothetical protein